MSEHERELGKVRPFPVDKNKTLGHEGVDRAPIEWDPEEVRAILSGRLFTKRDTEGTIDECKILLQEAAFMLEDGQISVPSLVVRPADNFISFTNGVGDIGNTGSFLSDVVWIGQSEDEENEVCIRAENEQGEITMWVAKTGDITMKSEGYEPHLSPNLKGMVFREIDRLGDEYLDETENDSPNRTETGYNNVVQLSVWRDKK